MAAGLSANLTANPLAGGDHGHGADRDAAGRRPGVRQPEDARGVRARPDPPSRRCCSTSSRSTSVGSTGNSTSERRAVLRGGRRDPGLIGARCRSAATEGRPGSVSTASPRCSPASRSCCSVRLDLPQGASVFRQTYVQPDDELRSGRSTPGRRIPTNCTGGLPGAGAPLRERFPRRGRGDLRQAQAISAAASVGAGARPRRPGRTRETGSPGDDGVDMLTPGRASRRRDAAEGDRKLTDQQLGWSTSCRAGVRTALQPRVLRQRRLADPEQAGVRRRGVRHVPDIDHADAVVPDRS